MILSINWLRDHLLKQDVPISAGELAEELTMRGIQVTSVKHFSTGIENVVVGRIEQIEKHPNADRLQITHVQTSPDESPRQIVCGATNIAPGDIVPVALPGCVLPNNVTIKISMIRGVESRGMICSAKELGVSDDAEGILQLPKHSQIGEPVSRLLGGSIEDTLLELEITPNRGDCLSVIGLAREIAPILKTRLRDPKPDRFRITPHRTSSIVKIEVEDASLCPRYVARVVDGIQVSPSPDWIQQRLQAVGIRAINNIVDITNFIMLEYGQPLHAFDLRKIESGGLKVGACKGPTLFTTLNNETVLLKEGDILIQDGERPVAIAGIMGGANTQVDSETTSIILESAAFAPNQIRRTSKRLGLLTDSAKRFEKGVDLAGVALASERAAALLRDSFNANVYHPPIDTNESAAVEIPIAIDMREVRKSTGVPELASETATTLLGSIGMQTHQRSPNILSVKVPSFRPDIRDSVDVIEEIARLYGYDKIPAAVPISTAAYDRMDESPFEFEQRIKRLFSGLGLRETIHYSFVSEELLSRNGVMTPQAVSIQNPISDEMKVLRTSLLPSLIETYLYNKNRQQVDQRIFELARTFAWDESQEKQVKETPYVAGLLSGRASPETWHSESKPVDFFLVKGLVEILIRQLTTVFLASEPQKESKIFHPAKSAVMKLGLKDVGILGEIHPHIAENYLKTQEPIVLFEIHLEALRKYERTQVRFKPPSKFPGSNIDVAFTVDKNVTSHQLNEAISYAGGNLLQDIFPFDVYLGSNIPEGKKSLAFHLFFQSHDRTLQDSEILTLRDKIVTTLKDRFGAELRA